MGTVFSRIGEQAFFGEALTLFAISSFFGFFVGRELRLQDLACFFFYYFLFTSLLSHFFLGLTGGINKRDGFAWISFYFGANDSIFLRDGEM